jgi:hypothetical protein
MAEPDFTATRSAPEQFDDLRADVETMTYLPEFREVEDRARRVKRWMRVRAVAVALAITVPAASAITVLYEQPNGTSMAVTGRDDVVHLSLPGRPEADSWTLVAADGVDLEHLYGLVDVCSGHTCSMQLSSIDPNSITGTVQRMSLFRAQPTDTVSNTRLSALGPYTVMVSASVNSGPQRNDTLGVNLPSGAPSVAPTKRVVQPVQTGMIEVAAPTGLVSAAPTQPALTQPTLLSSTNGWWVSGTDPVTGQLALAVSDDGGKSWASRTLGIEKANAVPALAVSGDTVYLLVAAGGHLQLRKSADRGHNWSTLTATQTWPAAGRYGIIIRPDHSLLVWLDQSNGTTTLLHSTNGGLTFAPDRGADAANGGIVTLSDGYVMLGAKAYVSRDAETWTLLQVPWLPQN